MRRLRKAQPKRRHPKPARKLSRNPGPRRNLNLSQNSGLSPIPVHQSRHQRMMPTAHRAKRRGRKKVLVAAGGSALSALDERSEEHTSELQSLMRISYAVFCLTTKTTTPTPHHPPTPQPT